MKIGVIKLRQHLIIKRLMKTPSSFEDLSEYLKQESEIRGDDLQISIRTFKRDREDILTSYGIEIIYDAKSKVYKIVDLFPDEIEFRLTEAFDLMDAISLSQNLSAYLFFENRRAKGSENLYQLLQAIIKKHKIEFDYKKYYEDKPTQREVSPYALKEFKNRWYLLARDIKDDRVKTFALDRISNIIQDWKKIDLTKKVDPQKYFRYSFGVETIDEEPREVILSFGPFQGKYIKSLPFHPSQETLIDNNEEFRIKLYILLTHDFMLELLSYGANIKVIAPDVLIKQLSEHYQKALDQYQ